MGRFGKGCGTGGDGGNGSGGGSGGGDAALRGAASCAVLDHNSAEKVGDVSLRFQLTPHVNAPISSA